MLPWVRNRQRKNDGVGLPFEMHAHPRVGGYCSRSVTQNSSYLVTGADGWLGGRLLGALSRGISDCPGLEQPPAAEFIRALRHAPLSEAPHDAQTMPSHAGASDMSAAAVRVEFVRGDLRDPALCARLCAGAAGATLFHIAGVIHPRRVRDFYTINVDGTRNLLSAAAQAGVRRAVVMSSNSPCGCNARRDERFDEDSPYNPYMHYGRSKQQMEQVAQRFHAEGRLEVVIIRAPWFYGPEQPARQTLFFRMIRAGVAPLVGDGENRRSMAYLDNLCQGLWRAAQTAAAAGRTYWIADAQPYTMNEIIDTIERLLETEFGQRCAHRRRRLPGWIAEAAGVVDATLQGLGLYHQKVHVLSEMNKTIACSIERARRELGYSPQIALEEGMRRSLRWLVEHRPAALR